MNIEVYRYNEDIEKKWDYFVEFSSMNGTFLQTRNFLNYHPKDRFTDFSLIVYKGNIILAVIPGCELWEKDIKIFSSHHGSTFGGLVVNKDFYNIIHIDEIIKKVEAFLIENNFKKILIKNTSQILSLENVDLIEYFLFKNGYSHFEELNLIIDYKNYSDDILSNYTVSRRRGHRKAEKHGLVFKKIDSDSGIGEFYDILCGNLKKFESQPVHSLEELLDLRKNRIPNNVDFYGVYYDDVLIAGSMVFKFNPNVLHSQYLASDHNYSKLFPMNFLGTNLIKLGKKNNYQFFSFGISTENRGTVLNYGLAEFKEGFGSTYVTNKIYCKSF